MIKLPEKKYEPKHNNELKEYAKGWNTTIKYVKDWFNKYGYEYAKESLLKNKHLAYQDMRKPFYKGVYDCILEIERLNEEAESEYSLYSFFQDSLEALDKLNIRVYEVNK